MAEDLPRTKLSEYIETHVRSKMNQHLKELAEEKVQHEGIDIEEAKAAVTMGGTITIRQVTSMDRKLEVRQRMKKRYAFKNYPHEFTYRCKCFIVFQNLDGVDVILFGLYVYEHDEKNPLPNQRAVYVSYLDSVHYMRPRTMRTFIYHEILISYLDYVRRRGFSTAHIWACPPLKGDDYILYAKPEDQKTPKDDRLRQWYIDMLVDCQKRGIVGKLTNMYDLYFSDKGNDAAVVPYMEGDYFPAEVENIIKDIEEGKVGKKNSGKEGKKKKGDKKQKRKSGRGGTRSSGIDEEALKASGIQFPGKDQKSLEEGGRDYVMVKLGETIQPMKESFIVAFLAWKGAKKENMVVPKAIEEYRAQHNITIEFGPEDCPKETMNMESKRETSDKLHKGSNGAKNARSGVEDENELVNPESEGLSNNLMEDAEKRNDNGTQNDKMLEDAKMKVAENSDISKTYEKPDDPAKDAKKQEGVNAKDKKMYEDTATKDSGRPEDGSSKFNDKPADVTTKGVKTEVINTKVVVKSEDADIKDVKEPKDVMMTDTGKDSNSVVGDESSKSAADDRNSGNTGMSIKDENSADRVSPSQKAVDDSPPVSSNKGTKKDFNGNAIDGDGKVEKKSDSTLVINTNENGAEEKNDTSDDLKPGQREEEKGTASEKKLDKIEGKVDTIAETSKHGIESKTSNKGEASKPTLSMEERSGKFAAMAKKRGLPAEEKTEMEEKNQKKEKEAEVAPVIYVLDSKGRRVKVIDDDSEEMDCEFLNNRQAFLNLCQGNHYQFDQLRRAKHSSMMVLWHLHNRDAPKFVQQCTTCSREILQGYRFHCPICADFDQCQDCIQNPNIPRHPHQLKPIAISGQQTELTEAQRKERQRSIQLHMTLLQHAATCNSPKCPSANCTKMKGLLKHGAQCQIKATGGCNVCKRIWALLQIHARQCKAQQCPVPNCMAIRERVRQLKKQQQAMDDRRRQEMNRVYRGAR